MVSLLFIHPDKKLSQLYAKHMSQHFVFDSAHDGLSGIRKIRQIKPNLIVSEYHLPMLSGASVLKFVRSHPQLHHIPFLFLTDHLDPSRGLSLGANDWLARESTHPQILTDKVFYHIKLNPHAL